MINIFSNNLSACYTYAVIFVSRFAEGFILPFQTLLYVSLLSGFFNYNFNFYVSPIQIKYKCGRALLHVFTNFFSFCVSKLFRNRKYLSCSVYCKMNLSFSCLFKFFPAIHIHKWCAPFRIIKLNFSSQLQHLLVWLQFLFSSLLSRFLVFFILHLLDFRNAMYLLEMFTNFISSWHLLH